MSATPVMMVWSGGKDSAMALWRLQSDPAWQVVGLLTTVTEQYERISMHGVRNSLLDAQAESLGLPLHRVWIPAQCSNGIYESRMLRACQEVKSQGVQAMAFGDLFLEDIREYRERMLEGTGISAVYPIWGEETRRLARQFLEEGFRANLVCVDEKVLSGELCGRDYDESLLNDLPSHIDPCGENGEFHTFVHDGPNFSAPVPLRRGETVSREGFTFTDFLPAER